MTLFGNWVFFKIPKYVFISDSTQDDDSCSYSCQTDGGCEVRKDGWLGSCFPPSFGGECDGTPPGCSDCSQKCQGKNGSRITSNSHFGSSYVKRYGGGKRKGGLAGLVDGFAGIIG